MARHNERALDYGYNFEPHFQGPLYDQLASHMQMLRKVIEESSVLEIDTDGQERLDARFVCWISLIKDDLDAIRLKLDQRHRNMARMFFPSNHKNVDDSELLERNVHGQIIHTPQGKTRPVRVEDQAARRQDANISENLDKVVERIEHSIKDQAACREDAYIFRYLDELVKRLDHSIKGQALHHKDTHMFGYMNGVLATCISYALVKLAAPCFGDYQIYAKWAMGLVGLYLVVLRGFVKS